MAILDEAARVSVWTDFARDNRLQLGNLTKADLRAAVNALDDFLNSNAAAINSAIPQPARAELTAKQKAMLLMQVIAHRFKVEA